MRIRQDDVAGTPLLDFLTRLSASANAHATETYAQELMLPAVRRVYIPLCLSGGCADNDHPVQPTGLVAQNIEEPTYSPLKGGEVPSYSFP